jgi:hypothetical protein
MHAMWLMVGLVWGGTPAQAQTAEGTLLFLENSNAFVELYTGSETTHVAIVLSEDGQAMVYEATPHEVRKVPLDDYYAELGQLNQRRKPAKKIRLTMAQPRDSYSDEQLAAMRKFVTSKLGTRYSIKGYVRGESDGVHCAELAARTLCAAKLLDVERCHDESPATLLEKVKPVSRPLAVMTIVEPTERPNWCERRWTDWSAFSGWCQWSCWETLSFCW